MSASKDWFSVDKEGLAKILERRGKVFALYELISNAWDTNATDVKVTAVQLTPQRAIVTIEDDDPEGFKNLTHAFTLFAESDKKDKATKRGRFNLGEKLVLAICENAEIMTTTGSVTFDRDGRHASKARRERGSLFFGKIRMKKAELDEALKKLELLIPPKHVRTYVNGQSLPYRSLHRRFECALPTEISDEDGNLKKTTRKTHIEIYKALPGEPAMIYEMGVPIVETGDAWHVNVLQKVPLNMDRDNVTPAYLREVRTLVLNEMAGEITPTMSTASWVREAAGDARANKAAVEAAITARFGDKRVSYDPSDLEANKLAVAAGYTVVHGGSLSSGEWENARRENVILPAGKVTPSPKPFHPDGKPLALLDRESWTPGMRRIADYADRLGRKLLDADEVIVQITNDRHWHFLATYGNNTLTLNAAKLGGTFFTDGPTEEVDRLLLHEFSHHFCMDHLDDRFAEAGFRLGAKLKRLALDHPEMFK